MTTKPQLSQTLEQEFKPGNFYKPKKAPENLPNRKRLLFEIEKLLEIEREELKLETIRKKGSNKGRSKIPNRDIYRIYKAILNMKNIQPSVIYTGGSILDAEEAEQLLKETDKELKELEPSL